MHVCHIIDDATTLMPLYVDIGIRGPRGPGQINEITMATDITYGPTEHLEEVRRDGAGSHDAHGHGSALTEDVLPGMDHPHAGTGVEVGYTAGLLAGGL
jgi:hypothetical protein